MNPQIIINLTYIVSAGLFIMGLKMLGSPATARKGNAVSALGMILAVMVTFITQGLSFQWIFV